MLHINQKPKRIVSLLIATAIFLLQLPLAMWAANLLQNDGLEPPFARYGEWSSQGTTFDLEVAEHWERFFVPDGTEDDGNKLRYFRSSAVEFLFGFIEKRDGEDAQLYWSTKPFDAGIYQQISSLAIGEHYGFQAGILQVYANTTSKTHGKMFRSVGLDPYGGTDPTNPDVTWSPEEGLDVDWFYPGVGTQALSSTVTVFVRVRSLEDSPQFEENSVWVDDTFFDLAPTTTLTLTVDSPTQVTAAWTGLPRTGYHLFAHEAQYRQATDSARTDLQIFDSSTETIPTATGASFAVEPGVEYIVRARTWHEQDSGDSHEVPGPWVEAGVITGGFVSGQVLTNRGAPINNATVIVSASPDTSTTSDNTGSYRLFTGPGTFGLMVSDVADWTIPHPISVTVPNLASVTPLSLTLRPPDDVIKNGDFENDLDDWQVSGTVPTTSTTQIRTVSRSLRLADNTVVSQTGLISGSYEPTLSFWYRVDSGDGDDLFTAEILGPGQTPTHSFSTSTVGEWHHAWLPLDLAKVYTGEVGVRFSLSQAGPTQTVVYLDEVSLGKAWGGPFPAYLPVLFK